MPEIALNDEHVMENNIQTPASRGTFCRILFEKIWKKYLEISNYDIV